MILKKYNSFLDLSVINETLDKSKKFMKDSFILNTAVNKIGLENLIDQSDADSIKSDMLDGLKRSFTPADFAKMDAEKKKILTDEMRSVKIGEDKVKELISSPTFKEIREIKSKIKAADGNIKEYQLDRDDIGWLYNFVYFYYYENMSIEDLTGLYIRLVENKDMLKTLEVNENGKIIKRPFDLNYVNIRIKNNAELLDDALAKIPNQRLYKKFESDLPSHLKRDLKESPQIIKDQFIEVAVGFDLLFKDQSGLPLTSKEDLEKADRNFKGFWGQMLEDRREGSPTHGQVVFQSPISRYKNVRDLIENAKGYLKGLGNSNFESFYDLFNKCNLQFGNAGATQMFLDKGIFIIEVRSFGANRVLNAHTSHCIKDSLSYWNSYVNSNRRGEFVEENKQYYIYNFNLMPSEQLWTIGVTIEPEDNNGNGYVRAAHDKIDRGVNPIRILGDWEKEYDLKTEATKRAKDLGASDSDIEQYGALFSIMRPLGGEEFEKRKLQRAANMEIIKPGLSIDRIKDLITKEGADVNRDNCAVLFHAVEEDDYEKIKLILNLGGSPNLRTGKQSIINSAKSLEVIKLLVERGSSITVEVYNNVCNDIDAVKFLLDAGVNPNFENSLPVRRACQGSWKSKSEPGESFLDTFKLLVDYGVKLDDHRGKFMILKWAAEYGRLDIIEEVVELGAEHGYVGAYTWMSHCEKIDKSQFKQLIDRLVELCERFEPEQWEALSPNRKWHLNLK